MLTTIMAYADVTWDTSTNTNCTISNGTLTGVTTTWGNAKSTTVITTTTNIQITPLSTSGTAQWFAGLGKDPYNSQTHAFQDIEYAWHTSDGSDWIIYESGVNKYQLGSAMQSTDVAEIKRDGSNILYYINGVLKYTSSTTTSDDLYAQGSAYGSGSVNVKYETSSSGGSGGSGGGGSDPPTQYTDGESKAHAHLKPLHIFRRQRDWF